MTTEEKLKVRIELANILARYGALKGKIKNYTSFADASQEEYADEIDSLNQVWDEVFIVWDKFEQAMALDSVPYSLLEPAVNQSKAIFSDTLIQIEKSIKGREEDDE